jgi:hypothetical protein
MSSVFRLRSEEKLSQKKTLQVISYDKLFNYFFDKLWIQFSFLNESDTFASLPQEVLDECGD